MVKMSLLVMLALTLLIFMGLRWREERMAATRPRPGAKAPPRLGWLAAKKREANRLVTAAALAAVATIVILGGLHWIRQFSGGW
jgi:hypothetical protein